MAITFKFGELEAILADLNNIPSASRTAFQARLKNYHRLGFPAGIGGGRGRAVVYTVGDLVLMAIAVEMTQLGLTPERAISVIRADEYPMLMSLILAARACGEAPRNSFQYDEGPDDRHPLPMYLYFDPAALSPWADDVVDDLASATFFYGGEGIVRENLARWTSTYTRRLSLINVTALVWHIAENVEETIRADLFGEIERWAGAIIHRYDFDLDEWLLGKARWSTSISRFTEAKPDDTWIDFATLLSQQGLLTNGLSVSEPVTAGDDGRAPDYALRLPGQRTLNVDDGTLPLADCPHEAIRDRVEFLAGNPFGGRFSDLTRFIVLYVRSDRFLRDALDIDKRLWDEARDLGVIILSPTSMRTMLDDQRSAWSEYESKHPAPSPISGIKEDVDGDR